MMRLSTFLVSVFLLVGCKPAPVMPTAAPAKPRVISASPAVTEILFALNAGDLIVGNTTFCDYPEAAKTMPKIGGFMPSTINIEKIIALKPDRVFIDGGVQKPFGEALTKFGITPVTVSIDSLDSLKFEIDRIAKELSIDPRPLLDRLKDAEHKAIVKVGSDRPRVFVMLGGQGLFTVGPNTVIHELVTLAGGKNIFDDGQQAYFTVSDEALLSRDPDVIIVPRPKDPEAMRKELIAKPGWANLKAIKNNRLYFVNEDTLSRTGPRYVQALEELVAVFHLKR